MGLDSLVKSINDILDPEETGPSIEHPDEHKDPDHKNGMHMVVTRSRLDRSREIGVLNSTLQTCSCRMTLHTCK